MRLYLKISALTLAGVLLWVGWTRVALFSLGLRYDLRWAWVSHFGNSSDLDRLLEDKARMQASEVGNLRWYELGVRYRTLLKQRMKEEEASRGPVSDDRQVQLALECCRQVYDTPEARALRGKHALPENLTNALDGQGRVKDRTEP